MQPATEHFSGHHLHKAGFTLIELSIVLVIIGLIVGGILGGRDLVQASKIRSVISQIDRYKSAVNTFKGKYDNLLPGDMPTPDAARFGLWAGCVWGACGNNGSGDINDHTVANNDGLIYMGGNQGQSLGGTCGGECTMFWRQLSDTHLIEGSFGRDLNGQGEPQTTDASGNYVLSLYAPSTPIPGVYVAIAGLHFSASYSSLRPTNENAFYFLKQGTTGAGPYMASLTPNEMYNIDAKIDDGKPTSGIVLAEDFAQFGTPTRYFSYTPTPGYCVSNITNNGDPNTFGPGLYNKDVSTGGNVVSCLPEFVLK